MEKEKPYSRVAEKRKVIPIGTRVRVHVPEEDTNNGLFHEEVGTVVEHMFEQDHPYAVEFDDPVVNKSAGGSRSSVWSG